jgi:hypothetical protein
MSSRYRKSIAETVGVYKDYISNTKKELQDSLKVIQKEQTEKHTANKKNIDSLEAKLNKVKDDILNVLTSINKSIEDIQKDILKDIKDKNNQILLNLDKKDKELKEVKKENTALNKDLKALKALVGKLELQKGDDGKSAYDIACELGFKGTKEEWIKSLHGRDGQDIELRGLRAFSDVKNDNKMYARKNKKWVEVEEYDDTELRNEIEVLQTENTRLKATLPTTTGEGENITLSKTAELEFIQPPLPRGNSEQVQYSGKNLLQNTSSSITTNGVTITVNEDGSLQLTGTATGNVYYYLQGGTSSYPLQLQAGTYTLSGAKSSSIFIRLGNANGMQDDLGSGKTFTINEATNYYCLLRITTGTATNTTIYPMIEEGSTATAYEPYVGGTASPNPSYPQEITNVTGDVEVLVQNKNLFDKTNVVSGKRLDNSGEATIDETGYCTTNYFIPVKPNTSYYSSVAINQSRAFCFYDSSKNFISRTMYTGQNVITTTSDTYYMKISILLSEIDTEQLEQGSTATTYTPHKEQTYTFPLGTQRMYLGDYLADDGIHHVRKQVVLDGSRNWVDYSTQVEGFYKAYTTGLKTNSKFYQNALCSHFAVKSTFNYMSAIEQCIASNANATYISISNSIVSNATELKTWLSEHNVTIEYELAEEEITLYTTEQQQAYDEIKQALSYNEQTNISGTSDESNPLFSVEAYQSIKLVLAG